MSNLISRAGSAGKVVVAGAGCGQLMDEGSRGTVDDAVLSACLRYVLPAAPPSFGLDVIGPLDARSRGALVTLADGLILRFHATATEEAFGSTVLCCGAAASLEALDALDASEAVEFAAFVVEPGAGEAIETRLHRFPHRRRYVARRVDGVLIGEPWRAKARLAPLPDGTFAEPGEVEVCIVSQTPVPPLGWGLFETGRRDEGERVGATMRAAAARGRFDRDHWANRAPSKEDLDALAPARVALVNRLLDVEDSTMQLRAENIRLGRELDAERRRTPGAQEAFDAPRDEHEWLLQRDASRTPDTLGLYDRRPDDAVILEGRAGEAFMDAFGLLGDTPDFVGAVSALNALEPVSVAKYGETPKVSLVIPIYGQLPYTLNCIDSLLRHRTRWPFEIIIIDDCSPDAVSEVHLPNVSAIRYTRQAQNGGFINSCNTGGALALGEFVVMLNNDTRVVEGWLDAMIDSFDLFPEAGLVGSKMLYPDGALQEAGGIIWRDGSAWNYGRNDDPNRPQYCYAREVDYISGCSIALRRSLWDALEGFDRHYTPAYAEDADLAMRVKAGGHQVWFQPQSRVIHYEGKTSGTSTGAGVKAYQVVNLKKLFVRWRERLETHRPNAEAPFFERERGVRRRMLFVDAVTPTPDQDAGSVQTVLGMRCARDLGYKVHFVPADNWLFEPGYTSDLQKEGFDCAYAPFEVGFDNYIRRYGHLFDVIVVYRVGIMSRVLDAIRQYAPRAAVIFHLADLHYLRMERQACLDGDVEAEQAAKALKEVELDLVRRSDAVVTHSTVEAGILADETPDAPTVVWPLMMEVNGTEAPVETRRDICFLGGYRHPPNIDAVLYFVEDVFPLVKAELPNVRFIAAGANPTPEILALACEDVLVPGQIPDLRDLFDTTRVFVCSLRVGAGAKGKVMSALSYGVPIVSTGIGVEGAGLEDGVQVLVADDPRSMADAIIRLYQDAGLWNLFSKAGQAIIEDAFSLRMGARQLAEAIDVAHRGRAGLLPTGARS